MKAIQILICAFLVLTFANSCGKQPNKNEPAREIEKPDPEKEKNIGPFFGFVEACVTEIKNENVTFDGDSKMVVAPTVTCSPKFSSDSRDELEIQLSEWSKTNCPSTIPVTIIEGSANFITKEALVVIDSEETVIDQSMIKQGSCFVDPLRSYGELDKTLILDPEERLLEIENVTLSSRFAKPEGLALCAVEQFLKASSMKLENVKVMFGPKFVIKDREYDQTKVEYMFGAQDSEGTNKSFGLLFSSVAPASFTFVRQEDGNPSMQTDKLSTTVDVIDLLTKEPYFSFRIGKCQKYLSSEK